MYQQDFGVLRKVLRCSAPSQTHLNPNSDLLRTGLDFSAFLNLNKLRKLVLITFHGVKSWPGSFQDRRAIPYPFKPEIISVVTPSHHVHRASGSVVPKNDRRL
eukprot:g16434.t1